MRQLLLEIKDCGIRVIVRDDISRISGSRDRIVDLSDLAQRIIRANCKVVRKITGAHLVRRKIGSLVTRVARPCSLISEEEEGLVRASKMRNRDWAANDSTKLISFQCIQRG